VPDPSQLASVRTVSSAQVDGTAARRLGFDAKRLARLDAYFARYVEEHQLAGWQLAVTRQGEIAHWAACGHADIEAGLRVSDQTLWRIYSMTKPVAAVTAMTLWEEGAFQLTDPISRWIPAFEHARVYVEGSATAPVTAPAREPIRVWHLMSHTSGITAGWWQTSVVDNLYRKAGYGSTTPPGTTLVSFCDAIAGLPLLFEPGTAWGYGSSTEVLGRLIEIWTGQTLDAAVAERVTRPLGMSQTVWHAGESDELAALYAHGQDGRVIRLDAMGDYARRPPQVLWAGGGLLSTLADYVRFTLMLAGGGIFDGVRVLSPRTLRLMTQNHLSSDLASLSTGGFHETTLDGVGFGLGFAVLVDPEKAHAVSSPGEYYWGGAASTAFWVDPVENLTAVFMTQLSAYEDGEFIPRQVLPIRPMFRQLVYSALLADSRRGH
jgi:CubicO group peptidase (beta-lactamase class C family)